MSNQDQINQLFNTNSKAFANATEQQYLKGTYKRGDIFLSQIQHKRLSKTSRILDYGCGTGRISLMLGQQGYTVLAIDPAQEHIDIANSLNQFESVTFETLNGKLNLAAESFDAVVSSSVLEFVPDVDEYIQNIANVLKPGGLVLVSVPNVFSLWRLYSKIRFGRRYKHFQFQKNVFTKKELADLFYKKGLQSLGTSIYFESAFDHKGLSFLNKSVFFGTLVLYQFQKR